MELHRVRGGNQEALENKEYNICVGISLGNKWFTPKNIVGLIEWSLEHTKEHVVVCPADDIHAINLEVRSRKSKSKSLELARKMSEELMIAVKEEVKNRLSEEQSAKIVYATWSDVVDEKYKEKVSYLYDVYEKDSEFRTAIQQIVRGYTSKEARLFSDEDITILSTYVLEELPEVVGRVPVKGFVCDAYAYPFDSELTVFIEQIQEGERFPEIGKAIMETEPKVFLEVR